jgi:hypothetical protein
MQCPGSHLKIAALQTISICRRGGARPHLLVPCHLWLMRLDGLTCATCACGMVTIWQSVAPATEVSSSFSSWMEVTADDMRRIREMNCLGLLMPCMRSSGDPKDWSQQEYFLWARSRALEALGHHQLVLVQEAGEDSDTA